MQQTALSVLNIQGMTCGHCVRNVETTLNGINGVKSVQVDLKGANAAVQFEPNQTTVQAMIDALEEAGYETHERAK